MHASKSLVAWAPTVCLLSRLSAYLYRLFFRLLVHLPTNTLTALYYCSALAKLVEIYSQQSICALPEAIISDVQVKRSHLHSLVKRQI